MTTVIANEAVQAALGSVKDKAEIRDAEGNLLGFFTPTEVELKRLYATVSERFDPEEIRLIIEREGHLPGRTTKEVLERLQQLA